MDTENLLIKNDSVAPHSEMSLKNQPFLFCNNTLELRESQSTQRKGKYLEKLPFLAN